jgi:Ala-tRNA(Pro) deacylase
MPELEGLQQPPHNRPASPEELLGFLAALGIETTTVEHPPLFTVEQSRSLRGQIAGGHTKNLFLKDKKDRLFLVVAEEDAKIELKHLHNLIGAQGRLSFGRPELLREALGVEPGSVTPFAAINDRTALVRVVLDQAMMRHQRLNFHPLVNTRTTAIGAGDLVRFLNATRHDPAIVAVSAG